VASAQDGSSLAGATVSALGGTVSTTTGRTGRFRLVLPAGAGYLVASRIGFAPETISVAADFAVDFRLRRMRLTLLDTLRVTGRYDTLTGIAASASEGRVGRSELMARPITREGELLETVPGVILGTAAPPEVQRARRGTIDAPSRERGAGRVPRPRTSRAAWGTATAVPGVVNASSVRHSSRAFCGLVHMS
jgi:hypothetical protein